MVTWSSKKIRWSKDRGGSSPPARTIVSNHKIPPFFGIIISFLPT